MTTTTLEPAFKPTLQLGRVCMTQGVHQLVTTGQVNPIPLLQRYIAGDWGNVSDNDRKQNDRAARIGDRIMAAYELSPTLTVWIITEWDRSVTTLLLPSEY